MLDRVLAQGLERVILYGAHGLCSVLIAADVMFSSYQLRVEIMLLREDFANTIGYISECVDTVIVTAQDMLDSKDLQELLYLVLVTGNFLNSVSPPFLSSQLHKSWVIY